MRLNLGVPRYRTTVLRVAPLLLCTSVPPLPKPELTIDVITSTSLRDQVDVTPALEEKLKEAWLVGWQEQADEIAKLSSMSEDDSPTLDLQQLWKDTDNSTEASTDERRQGARSVARELMRFWRYSTPRTDNLNDRLQQYDVNIPEEDTVTGEAALKERRRQLMRHAAAGVVEYRIFGEVLSRNDAVLDALPDAGLVPFEDVWRQLGGLANLTGWWEAVQDEEDIAFLESIEGLEDEDAMIESLAKEYDFTDANVEEMKKSVKLERTRMREEIAKLDPARDLDEIADADVTEALWELQVAKGVSWWQQWWVPEQIRSGGTVLYYLAREFEVGVTEPSGSLGLWLTLLARTIRRSADAKTSSNADADLADNAFPLLLLLVCVARQGNIEAAAVYQIARTLGAINNRVIAEREGFGVTTSPDTRVSEAEGSNTLWPIVAELYQLLEKEVAPYAVPYALGFVVINVALLALIFVLPLSLIGGAWYLTAEGVQGLIDIFVAQPDPLDF